MKLSVFVPNVSYRVYRLCVEVCVSAQDSCLGSEGLGRGAVQPLGSTRCSGGSVGVAPSQLVYHDRAGPTPSGSSHQG